MKMQEGKIKFYRGKQNVKKIIVTRTTVNRKPLIATGCRQSSLNKLN